MIEISNADPNVVKKVEAFIVNYKCQTFGKGEFLLRSNEQPQWIYFLQKGSVRMYAISKNGSELVLHIFRPMSFFPLTWGINNSPNAYYYEATTTCEAYKIPKDKAIEFIKANPDVLFDITARSYRGIDALLAKVMYQMSGSAYGKVLAEIYIYAKRFGEYTELDGKQVLSTVISERDLAAQSGLTRETVSRELKILKDKHILMFSKNNLSIFDMELLEEELAGAS